MTMPHLMNCSHRGDGWCLECVGKLQAEVEEYTRGYDKASMMLATARASIAAMAAALKLAKPILGDRSYGGRMLTTTEAASEAYAAVEAALIAAKDKDADWWAMTEEGKNLPFNLNG